MNGRKGTSAPLPRLAAALVLTAALAAACGPAEEAGEASSPDTLAPGPSDTAAAGDTAAPDTLPDAGPPGGADTLGADRNAGRADTAPADTAGPTRPPGRYMVYVRRGAVPDSVAADHGVDSLRLVPELPGFHARLTAGQATSLARDERVRDMARQIEGDRAPPEPRQMPAGRDTTGGG